MKYLVTILIIVFATVTDVEARVTRLLAIGNSFSEDAVEQNLYELALAQGDTLIIGNAYIGGCDINRHLDNLNTDKPEYAYRKIVGGNKSTAEKVDLATIIADEPWDFVTLQQASHYSGQQATYTNLPELRRKVMAFMSNKNAQMLWHATWSYSKSSTHPGFKNYGNNQQAMTDSINAAIAACVIPAGIGKVIPCGRAVEIARLLIGTSLTRDGYHLSYELGRYLAACVWVEALTGKSVVGNPYRPADLTLQQALAAQLAAHAARF